MLVPVPSHRFPAVFAKRASSAPSSRARWRATTFSAYEVVLSPAIGLCSLRRHGTVASEEVAAAARPAAEAISTVGRLPLRSDPSGPMPPVSVIRTRPAAAPLAASTARTPARSSSSEYGTSRPSPAADRRSRARWRVERERVAAAPCASSRTPRRPPSPRGRTARGSVRTAERSVPSTHSWSLPGAMAPGYGLAGGLLVGDQLGSSSRRLATARSRRALSSVSAHSPVGVESYVTRRRCRSRARRPRPRTCGWRR